MWDESRGGQTYCIDGVEVPAYMALILIESNAVDWGASWVGSRVPGHWERRAVPGGNAGEVIDLNPPQPPPWMDEVVGYYEWVWVPDVDQGGNPSPEEGHELPPPKAPEGFSWRALRKAAIAHAYDPPALAWNWLGPPGVELPANQAVYLAGTADLFYAFGNVGLIAGALKGGSGWVVGGYIYAVQYGMGFVISRECYNWYRAHPDAWFGP